MWSLNSHKYRPSIKLLPSCKICTLASYKISTQRLWEALPSRILDLLLPASRTIALSTLASLISSLTRPKRQLAKMLLSTLQSTSRPSSMWQVRLSGLSTVNFTWSWPSRKTLWQRRLLHAQFTNLHVFWGRRLPKLIWLTLSTDSWKMGTLMCEMLSWKTCISS